MFQDFYNSFRSIYYHGKQVWLLLGQIKACFRTFFVCILCRLSHLTTRTSRRAFWIIWSLNTRWLSAKIWTSLKDLISLIHARKCATSTTACSAGSSCCFRVTWPVNPTKLCFPLLSVLSWSAWTVEKCIFSMKWLSLVEKKQKICVGGEKNLVGLLQSSSHSLLLN